MSDFHDKFRIRELSIFENEHWSWSLRPEQTTIASGILYLKSHKPKFSDVSTDEMISLQGITRVLESTLTRAFNYDQLNYLMLMMVDRCVHMHVIPRYQNNRDWKGRTFYDFDFPNPPVLSSRNDFSDKELELLASYLKKFEGKEN